MLFSLTINLLLIGIVYLFFCNSTSKLHIKRTALLLAGCILICSCALVVSFSSNTLFFQDIITYTPGSNDDEIYIYVILCSAPFLYVFYSYEMILFLGNM